MVPRGLVSASACPGAPPRLLGGWAGLWGGGHLVRPPSCAAAMKGSGHFGRGLCSCEEAWGEQRVILLNPQSNVGLPQLLMHRRGVR